jgi:S1-C subfamily serine protease
VTVVSVDPIGSAARSGIQKGDIIVEIQRTPVSDTAEAQQILQMQSSLKQRFAAVLVQRVGKLSWISVAIPQ